MKRLFGDQLTRLRVPIPNLRPKFQLLSTFVCGCCCGCYVQWWFRCDLVYVRANERFLQNNCETELAFFFSLVVAMIRNLLQFQFLFAAGTFFFSFWHTYTHTSSSFNSDFVADLRSVLCVAKRLCSVLCIQTKCSSFISLNGIISFIVNQKFAKSVWFFDEEMNYKEKECFFVLNVLAWACVAIRFLFFSLIEEIIIKLLSLSVHAGGTWVRAYIWPRPRYMVQKLATVNLMCAQIGDLCRNDKWWLFSVIIMLQLMLK